MRDALERQQVVLAHALHLDVADQHELLVVRLEGGGEHGRRVHPQAREKLRIGTSDPGGGPRQAVPVRVLTDRDEDLPDRLLDPPEVDGLLDRSTGELAVDQSSSEVIEFVLRADQLLPSAVPLAFGPTAS
ncbi:hypothetical protein GCM10010168_43950 [Actinoplanes ianthinogenes]|uniref:Uncharacterized protein n=1 Tax=Actinoplanes ianthinogenes TaxID=122358 RepID=A0ABN6CEF9_9ACTN|nr:hypothetical protein Aiant_39530 [Actinoplanes ianthinogenes]GGR21108.1 hypothetical protein GCM10010168_43950 [Actinoplanes ianthinogenes]